MPPSFVVVSNFIAAQIDSAAETLPIRSIYLLKYVLDVVDVLKMQVLAAADFALVRETAATTAAPRTFRVF